jgi:hypothetical protein
LKEGAIMLVQWTDNDENLFEAGVIFSGPRSIHARIKKWRKEDRSATQSGAHSILYQGSSPPAHPARLIETLRKRAVSFGCPVEQTWKLREKP